MDRARPSLEPPEGTQAEHLHESAVVVREHLDRSLDHGPETER